jgi:hypothetical protein
MTRDERLARRRARGDARARVATPGRSIPSRRNRVRVFSSSSARTSRLSRRFRFGFGFARAPRPI